MSVTQTVEIPASHRLTIDVPREVPAGSVVLTFTPAPQRKLTAEEEIEYINRNAEWLNQQAEDTLEFQDIDAVFDDLERLTPQMLEVMRDTIVPINLADLVGSHDSEG
jgi:hypothetical protein